MDNTILGIVEIETEQFGPVFVEVSSGGTGCVKAMCRVLTEKLPLDPIEQEGWNSMSWTNEDMEKEEYARRHVFEYLGMS